MTNSSTATIQHWNQRRLAEALLSGLDQTEPGLGRWVNGRIVGLLASPFSDSATSMAVGVSALQRARSTPEHSHAAEELAIVLGGAGTIHIGDGSVTVGVGDVVLTPPDVPHRTESDPDQPLAILWIYAPPDSALRWLADNPVEN